MEPGVMEELTREGCLPELPGRRVALRPLRPGDVPALFEVFSDPEVMRYWSSAPLGSVADAWKLYEEIGELFDRRELFQWGIARREDDRVVGTVTLFRVEPAHRRGEIGFALGPAHQGRGLAGEAVGLLLDFAFERLGLERIEADVDPRNAPSLRLLERFGFVREGLLRDRYRADWVGPGVEVQDAVLLGLLRRQWAR